jgi:hypothetical protein
MLPLKRMGTVPISLISVLDLPSWVMKLSTLGYRVLVLLVTRVISVATRGMSGYKYPAFCKNVPQSIVLCEEREEELCEERGERFGEATNIASQIKSRLEVVFSCQRKEF